MDETDEARFWMSILSEMNNHGVRDVFIACIDGLAGFDEEIEAVYPNALLQQCIIHLTRCSLAYVKWKVRKRMANDLRRNYTAATEVDGEKWASTRSRLTGVSNFRGSRAAAIGDLLPGPGLRPKVNYTAND